MKSTHTHTLTHAETQKHSRARSPMMEGNERCAKRLRRTQPNGTYHHHHGPPKKGNAPPNVHATGNEESGVLIYKMELRQDFPYVRVGSAKCTVKKHDTHEAFS